MLPLKYVLIKISLFNPRFLEKIPIRVPTVMIRPIVKRPNKAAMHKTAMVSLAVTTHDNSSIHDTPKAECREMCSERRKNIHYPTTSISPSASKSPSSSPSASSSSPSASSSPPPAPRSGPGNDPLTPSHSLAALSASPPIPFLA